MKTSARNLLIGLLSALLLVLAGVGAVWAAETPEATSDTDGDRFRGRIQRLRDRDGGRFARAGARPAIFDEEALLQAAAGALGLTADELRAAKDEGRNLSALLAEQDVARADFMEAMRAAKQRMIDDALQDGAITQAQAERLRARRAGMAGGNFGHRSLGRYRGAPAVNLERLLLRADIFDRDILTQAVAAALGMTPAELEAAKAKGPEAFEAMDIDGRTLGNALRDARQRMIDSALESGAITQEQADRLDAWMERGPRKGFGRRGHHAREFGKRLMAPEVRRLAQRVFDEDLMLETVAAELDMTAAELEAAKTQGLDAFEDLDIDEGTLKTSVRNAQRQLIDDALETGDITQAQANRLRAWLDRDSWEFERKGHDRDATDDADEREGHDRGAAGDADQGAAG